MYAIQNIKTGEFVCGTDYRYSPPHQKTSRTQMVTYKSLYMASVDFMCQRRCGKDYRIVLLKSVEVKKVFDFDTEDGYDLKIMEGGV